MTTKIAISSMEANGLNSAVSGHFGRCPYFIIAEVEGNEIKSTAAIANPYAQHHQPGQVPQFINEQGVNVMLSGGMGRRAVDFFNQYGIDVATGATGTVQTTLQNYLSGKLNGAKPCAESESHHRHE
jgi:predicted Fe-Mo cluster-binding NifX family protein